MEANQRSQLQVKVFGVADGLRDSLDGLCDLHAARLDGMSAAKRAESLGRIAKVGSMIASLEAMANGLSDEDTEPLMAEAIKEGEGIKGMVDEFLRGEPTHG